MKSVYYSYIKNIYDALPSNENVNEEKIKSELTKKLVKYSAQITKFINSQPAMEDQMKKALEKYPSTFVLFREKLEDIKSKYYQDFEYIFLEKDPKPNNNFITMNNLSNPEEMNFFKGVKIEEKEAEIIEIVSKQNCDKLKNFLNQKNRTQIKNLKERSVKQDGTRCEMISEIG
ncbi:hypothetical protein HE1_00291 [Holospora elegans E1]|uniref:Uncharacterized protein n=1 Tax=Holospora elegans E1 TaxID=1427503 RepID=A0A023DX95_9PROT|nr:hypothetical protein [Holospora elegans]GAJ45973.1 hypothetical protein HE1_00291 [Holospora elegans E1]